MVNSSVEELKKRIEELEIENSKLKSQITQEQALPVEKAVAGDFLSLDEYKRYGRQMIVPQITKSGQRKIKESKILVIGAGGLGCPALMYLVGAGIGEVGIVDDDVVDISNLHRQVLHSTERVGEFKAESAKKYLVKLNPHVKIKTYPFRLSTTNAFNIFEKYDLVLDCTDSPHSRYLISDVAVISRIPVISGSGLKTEGQLTVLNFENIGPCYRCFYPKPPPPNSVTSCKDGGVIGPIIGLMGVMMAIETLKVITGTYTKENFKPFLSMYSGYDQQSFKTFKMRGRKLDCISCNYTLTREFIENGGINYSEFCGVVTYDVLNKDERITIEQYEKLRNSDHVLLDVRPKEHFEIVSFPGAINIPLDRLRRIEDVNQLGIDISKPIYTICRYGNDSQYASRYLNDHLKLSTKDVIGGLNRWSTKIDSEFPSY
ncbi:hypothetical protein WICMUC_004372 [Wickerhamomyces mucosus]|uniref:Needs CLA4 to survive protein 3 n=1 Tax=Wickerhamomyces mucosus TaxID=1378264 RepID=A0A9P8PI70_9ASCO|nr:hypothetical protein WICMUC_004372 [Wickerhamomyces mucosus]